MHSSVLLDTSFFIRLLNENDPLFTNANDYYKYFLENDFKLVLSTISIAEFCVKGALDNLPLKDLQVLPFNLDHARKAGEFAKEIFQTRGVISITDRKIIPNDTNLFSQSEVDKYIAFYLSSDGESKKIFDFLNGKFNSFNFLTFMCHIMRHLAC